MTTLVNAKTQNCIGCTSEEPESLARKLRAAGWRFRVKGDRITVLGQREAHTRAYLYGGESHG